MNIDGQPYRSIWLARDGWSVEIIDQAKLPHVFEVVRLASLADAARAIATMQVRGAPLIGATAGYGIALAMRAQASDAALERAIALLGAQRPTAVNLSWALASMRAELAPLAPQQRVAAAYRRAQAICEEEIAASRSIARHGASLIEAIAARVGERKVNVLTHCNAGWLACVDWGTALAPIYEAHDRGVAMHVWVDETRPRNQGASLTTFELKGHGVPNTLIVDNAGGHLMQQGRVDLCIVGADRVTANGDVANKIGTYLKALAAHDNGVPFYVAFPHSTVDFTLANGAAIPIEARAAEEVLRIPGRTATGEVVEVAIAPADAVALNDAFDVTPARLITGFITERGVCSASRAGLAALYGAESEARPRAAG
jgi:methylthioribose-1-phosphate isomerase